MDLGVFFVYRTFLTNESSRSTGCFPIASGLFRPSAVFPVVVWYYFPPANQSFPLCHRYPPEVLPRNNLLVRHQCSHLRSHHFILLKMSTPLFFSMKTTIEKNTILHVTTHLKSIQPINLRLCSCLMISNTIQWVTTSKDGRGVWEQIVLWKWGLRSRFLSLFWDLASTYGSWTINNLEEYIPS